MTNYFFALEARGTRLKFARRWGRVMMALSVAGTIGLTACEEALEVTDPDVIDQGNVTSPEAAEGLRVGAFARLANMTSGGESTLHFPGLLVDEWRSGDTFVQRDETDKRTLKEEVTVVSGMWYDVNRARTAANQAIVALNEFPPVATASLPQNQSSIGQMFWLRGFAETAIAENYCNGTPISAFDLKGSVITYGNPESNVQVYNRAIASFDSGAAAAGATLRGDTVRILARIGKARVLMNLGRFNDAATVLSAAPAIPSEFRFRNFHQEAVTGTATNQIWALNNSGRRYVVGDRDGGVGLNFASANDPRVPTCRGNDAVCRSFGVTNAVSFDNNFGAAPRIGGLFQVQLIWPTRDDDVVLVSGVEARLLEAEAQLRSGNAAWLTTLNTLRANFQTLKDPSNTTTATATLAPLTDPGTQVAREDLLFRERAFWLFGRGHRLADVRRLARPVAQGGFGRPLNSVYPNGTFFKGGTFGDNTAIPVPQNERNNPNFQGCTDNNP